jgi:flagellar assembly factor FliW
MAMPTLDSEANMHRMRPRARVLETRFGQVTVARDAILEMPTGPLGFEDRHSFALLPFPDGRFARFALFQCIEDVSLSFIVMPYNRNSSLYEQEDLDEAAASLGTDADSVQIYLIVTVRSTPDGPILTCNLRAPVVIDTPAGIARQCVLLGSRHSIRHVVG